MKGPINEALVALNFKKVFEEIDEIKAQLQAVTDPNHFTLGDTLDLIANGTSLPISDVVNTTTVNITSLAAQNLKIRIL